jgi:hypothetical protein
MNYPLENKQLPGIARQNCDLLLLVPLKQQVPTKGQKILGLKLVAFAPQVFILVIHGNHMYK